MLKGGPLRRLRWVISEGMRRYAMPAVISTVAVALLALLAFGIANSGTSSSIDGQVRSGHFPQAPGAQTALPLLGSHGRESLAQLRGHVVMVNFFAGWCDACQADANVVRSAQRLLARVGGTTLGVTFQDSSIDAASFMRRYHLRFPVLRDANGGLASAYGVNGVPETFIVNPQGRIVALDREQLTSSWLKTLAHAISQAP